MILDDVFGMYDEERLAAVLAWLHKEGRQIVISTCHKEKWNFWSGKGFPTRGWNYKTEKELSKICTPAMQRRSTIAAAPLLSAGFYLY